LTIFTVPDTGGGGVPGPSGPTGATGPEDARYYLRFTHGGGVPIAGTQYLRLGVGVFSSESGDLLTADGTLIGISVTVNAADVTRDYDVEVLSDPAGLAGGPTVLGTLALSGVRQARRRDLAVAVGGLLDLGVRLVRTAGAGASTFTEIIVVVEAKIP
jgi:hypothetical protein